MAEIFISYARSTETQADQIGRALAVLGYEIWRDDKLPAHRVYSDVINEQLRESAAVVVVWSKAATASHWVRAEADVALQADKLVQVSVDGAKPPLPFNQVHCVDLATWSGDPKNPQWRVVLSSIEALIRPGDAAGAKRKSTVALWRSETHLDTTSEPGLRPALSLPARPSIAVLPFKNNGAESAHEYFVDGISEDIITALSRWHWFFVIASSSSFTYKGHDIDVSRVGRELGVRYVLEGAVRRVANRVRITAQLVDTANGSHVWAERFDRELVDLLALQDEITEQVVAAVEPAMLHSEGARKVRKSLDDFDALDCFYRGMWHLNKISKTDCAEALSLFRDAVQRDPNLSLGHIGLARALFAAALFGWSSQPVEDLRSARLAAQTAIRLDGRDAWAYYACSVASLYLGDHGAAMSEARTATSLNPNFALAQVRLGQVLLYGGRAAEGIAPIERGVRLSPYDPQLWVTLEVLALAYYQARDYEQAMVHAKEAMHLRSERASIILAASLARLGREKEAGEALPLARWVEASPQRPMAAPYADPADLEHLRQGVRLARVASKARTR
jgi:adenylate cyclase